MLNQIQLKKIDMLNVAFNALLGSSEHGEELFKKTGESSFISFHGNVLKAIDQNPPIISLPFSNAIDITPEQATELETSQQMAVEAMHQIDYEPPIDPIDKLIHLKAMWEIYKTGIPYPPTTDDLCFDLSFTKLIADVHREIAVKTTKAEREIFRGAISAQTKREKAQEKKDLVLVIYHLLKKTNSFKKMTLHAVATAIKFNWDKFSPKEGFDKSPGITQIKKYLKEDQQIMGEIISL